MNLHEEDVFLARHEIVFREEDDGAFLFDPETGDLTCLNPMGGVIWQLCDGTRTLEDLLRDMSSQYPLVETDRLQRDLMKFLQELVDTGYLGREIGGDAPR